MIHKPERMTEDKIEEIEKVIKEKYNKQKQLLNLCTYFGIYRSWEQLKELDIGIHFFNSCECLIYDCDLNVITNKKLPKL